MHLAVTLRQKSFDSKEMQPVHMGLLCRLQLRDCHAYESNRFMGIDHDYRACFESCVELSTCEAVSFVNKV